MTRQNCITTYEKGGDDFQSNKKNFYAAIPTREIVKIVEKDLHLIEAAVLTDKLII